MKRWTAMIVGLCGLLAFAAPAAAQKETRIGIVTLQMKAPYFIAMVRALEAEGRAHNVRTFVADGNGDVAKVNSDIEDLLAKGVDGLIMNISPLEALPGGMAAIKKAGKPLVLVNRKLKGGEYDAWIGVDNFNTAAGVGEVIAKRMGGKGNLLMIRGGPEDNSTGNARRDGVLSKVKDTGIKVTFAPEFGKWTEDGGIRVMEDMLAKHKDINAVFCEGDVMCLGAQKAIADAGRSAADPDLRLRRPEGGDRADHEGLQLRRHRGQLGRRDREGRLQDHDGLARRQEARAAGLVPAGAGGQPGERQAAL